MSRSGHLRFRSVVLIVLSLWTRQKAKISSWTGLGTALPLLSRISPQGAELPPPGPCMLGLAPRDQCHPHLAGLGLQGPVLPLPDQDWAPGICATSVCWGWSPRALCCPSLALHVGIGHTGWGLSTPGLDIAIPTSLCGSTFWFSIP